MLFDSSTSRFAHFLSKREKYVYMIISICILLFAIVKASVTNGVTSTYAKNDVPSSGPAMGINMSGLSDWGGDFTFADAMKESRHWGLPNQPWVESARVDEHGWPTEDAGVVVIVPVKGTSIDGTYKLSFAGQATVAGVASNITVQNQAYDANTNITTANLVVATNSQLDLAFTNTKRHPSDNAGTGVTDVRLMLPTTFGSSTSYSPTTTFTDGIKVAIDKFQAIRFMDFAGTNGNMQTAWSDRRLPAYASQASQGSKGGGAWEYAIQLCNETNKDAYINIPEMANNDYITQLAHLFKYGSDANGNVYTSEQSNPVHPPLKPNLHLYIEYSNEIWNFSYGFDQSRQNVNAIKAAITGNTAELQTLNYDHKDIAGPNEKGEYNNQWALVWRRQAERIKETSDLFRSVFGDNAMMTRVRPILEWQYGGLGTGDTELSFLNGYYNNGDGNHVPDPHPVNYFLWGGGGAAYSSVKNPGAGSIDDMYNSGLDTRTVGGTVGQDVILTRGYGLHEIAYEGGFQIGDDNPSEMQISANLDPRAKQMEIDAQTTFNHAGGELLMYFSIVGRNAYGLANPAIADQKTPKLQAIDVLNQSQQAAPTAGTALPTVVGQSVTIPESKDGTNKYLAASGSPAQEETLLLNVSQMGTYTLTFYGTQEDPNGKAHITLDGQAVQGTIALPQDTAGASKPPSSLKLAPGLHSLFLYIDGPKRLILPPDGKITVTLQNAS